MEKTTADVLSDVEYLLVKLHDKLDFRGETHSSLMCKELGLCRFRVSHHDIDMIFNVLALLVSKASKCCSTFEQNKLFELVRRTADMASQMEVVCMESITDRLSLLFELVLNNQKLQVPGRQLAVLEATLQCRLKLDKRLIRDMGEHYRFRMALPVSPAVLMYACNVPSHPWVRAALYRMGVTQWNAGQMLNYVGMDIILERALLRGDLRVMPDNFEYTVDSYSLWPLQSLSQTMSNVDFALACFAISEMVHCSSKFDQDNVRSQEACEHAIIHLREVQRDSKSWLELRSTWMKNATLRCKLYKHCFIVHGVPCFNSQSMRNHSKLRIGRAHALSSLHPGGREYIDLWVLFWQDVLYNLSYDSWKLEEMQVMREGERVMQLWRPTMNHWVAFLVATTKVEYHRVYTAHPTLVMTYLMECSPLSQETMALVITVLNELHEVRGTDGSYLHIHYKTMKKKMYERSYQTTV